MNYLIRSLLVLFITISPFLVLAQQHEIIFQQCYGGSDVEAIKNLQKSSEKYLIFGSTHSIDGDVSYNHGRHDLWLFETDLSGNIYWEKVYGGSDHEWAKNMLPLDDGGYLLFGSAWSTDGDVSGLHGGGFLVGAYRQPGKSALAKMLRR
ncbi:MAG: hypothetical protein K8F24_05980 [Bacteroidales bacterium]|nr:hypothetical protein [Bacteroidales bacterium]